MISLQAIKHEEPHRNQQERLSLRELENENTKSAENDDYWKKQQKKRLVDKRDERLKNEINQNNWKSINNELELENIRNNPKLNHNEEDVNISVEDDEVTKTQDRTNIWSDVISIGKVYSNRCSETDNDVEEMIQRNDDDKNDELYENMVVANEEENEEENDNNDDNEIEKEIESANDWIRKKIITTSVDQEANFHDNDDDQTIQKVVANLDDTSFGDINVANSNHVHVGNTNFYKGPVTIKQFVYTSENALKDKNKVSIKSTIDGDNYSGRISDIETNDVTNFKGDHDRPILPTYGDYDRVTKWLWTWRCAAILCVVALSSVTIVVVLSLILSNKNGIVPEFELPDTPTSGINPDDVWTDSVRFVERNDWIAQPAKEKLNKLTEVPAPYVIISHTATEPCKTQSECVLRVRLIQTFHMESRGWSDIGYNFVIGGDGLAYVGRGWDAEGAHAFGWNKKSIGISFIGTFNDVPPYKRQLHAALKVIEIGVQLGKISKNYKLLGHRQVVETLSPGDKLYNILKTLEHWSETP